MQVIRDFFYRHHIDTETIAVGVSGGADSLALVLLLKKELPYARIIALTVDHQLRPSSRQEAEYVASVMADFGIEHHILTWDGEKPTTGIEEAARAARYDLLGNWCKEHKVEYLAIAHHLYDQAETFLMRLERGSGLFGLSAMNAISERGGIKILRPLLHTDPEDLKVFLKEKNLAWVEDESNQCTNFLRVKMRQFIPVLQQSTGITPERLVTAAENLQNVRQFIEDMVEGIIQQKIHLWENSGYSFDYNEFLSWHDELKFYVISRLMQELSEQPYLPEATAIKELIVQISKKDFSGATLGGIYFCTGDLRLWLIKEHRTEDIYVSDEAWEVYVKEMPEVRGLKIPHKLRQALVYEKKHKK